LPRFLWCNISILPVAVLDEADRLLDMGFEKTLNAIVENLPQTRQSLLFSATQTKSVRDLARLSLKVCSLLAFLCTFLCCGSHCPPFQNPEYVAVHEQAQYSTPQNLVQNYIVCNLQDKLDLLFSFIRTHLKTKIIVFFSSCKEVSASWCFCCCCYFFLSLFSQIVLFFFSPRSALFTRPSRK